MLPSLVPSTEITGSETLNVVMTFPGDRQILSRGSSAALTNFWSCSSVVEPAPMKRTFQHAAECAGNT